MLAGTEGVRETKRALEHVEIAPDTLGKRAAREPAERQIQPDSATGTS